MKILDRFKKLTFWNKIAFFGSVASIIGVIVAVTLWFYPRSAPLNIYWPEVLDQLKNIEKQSQDNAFMTRTFSLSREQGASITLGNCPSTQCMKFTLGSLTQEDGTWIQEIILEGDGFGVKNESNSKYLFAMDSAVRLRGAELSISLTGGPLVMRFRLHKNSIFEMFTSHADLKFTVVDLNVDSLRIRLDADPPSGFSLN